MWVLPEGPRQRYRQEFLAELYGMSTSGQFRHVCGLLAQAWALQSEIAATEVRLEGLRASSRLTRLALCGTGVRHRWVPQFTDDGQPYDRCARCGADQAFDDYSNRAARRSKGAR